MRFPSSKRPTTAPRWTRALIGIAVSAVMLGAGAQCAMGFGTWDAPIIPGYAEHERITRLAIDCEGAFAKDPASPLAQTGARCAQARSATQIAGTDAFLGGVGAPDSAWDAVIPSKSPQHCDDGDYLFGTGSYPRPESARAENLLACRALFDLYMADAVRWAGEVVPVVGGVPTVVRAQSDLAGGNCNDKYDRKYDPDRRHRRAVAKCNALISFGRAMHIAQDFLSHSNWVDSAWPSSLAATGALNPPGLMKNVTSPGDVPDFLRYPRTAAQVSAFLAAHQVVTGGYTGSLTGRLRHSGASGAARDLNKDMGAGRIDWKTGLIPKGKGARGVAGLLSGQDNFQRAAYGAAVTTAAAWNDLQQAIRAAYPGTRGEMAARALAVDAPWTTCANAGATSTAAGTVAARMRENAGCAAASTAARQATPHDAPMTAAEVRALTARPPAIRACRGQAASVELAVSGLSCAAALRILRKQDEDLCPAAWRYRPGPESARVVCFLAGQGQAVATRPQVFTYVLPHFAEHHATTP